MVKEVLSVCWKDHTSEVATVYKRLLENNFLVDCTLSAEGQTVKAHRLVLSAGSPYFHKLFCEETGNHPVLILLDASFETLKAVIDFVYRGETQISERNLKAFLNLAQTLQIKGLNAFTEDNKKKNLSTSPNENVRQSPSQDNQVTCVVQSINASEDNCPENYSQQYLHISDGYMDAVHTNTSILFEGHSASCEEVCASQEYHKHLVCEEVEVCKETEIYVKHEPMNADFSTRNRILDNVKSEEPMSGNFTSEMSDRTTSVYGEQDLNCFSGCGKSSSRNAESSVMPHSQQDEPLMPAIFVPKSEPVDNEECEEPSDDWDMLGSDANETDEGTEPALGEHNSDQCSSAGGLPSEQDEVELHRGGQRRRPQETSASPAGLQVHVESLARKPPLATLPPSDGLGCGQRLQTGEQPIECDISGKDLTSAGSPGRHKRIHVGERTYGCEMCGNTFARAQNLMEHKRIHTGERPYACDVCGSAFTYQSSLVSHKRTHTGERPYRCDVCGISFTQHSTLVTHKRRHTGERPYRCSVCGKGFICAGKLTRHKRTHSDTHCLKASTLLLDESDMPVAGHDI